ncbi:hypothetical protein [Streptomyces sp. NPDC003688]
MFFDWYDAAARDAPTTARLVEVLNRAEYVVIVEASPDEVDAADRARTLVTGAEIADLARRLAIVDGGNGDRCRCAGGPTIMVYDSDGGRLACWTLHHQTGLRSVGAFDADLRDGPALTEWLAERGLTGSRDAQAESAVQRAESERRRMRWVHAAPAGLSDAAADVARLPGREASPDSAPDAEDRLAALTRHHYPEGIERARALLAWAGTAARESTGGLLWYDLTVQRQLFAEHPDHVVAALVTQVPSRAQLDGAAQFFGSLEWTREHGRGLPEPLRSTLVEHIRASGTDPMRFRLRHGYYGAEGEAP